MGSITSPYQSFRATTSQLVISKSLCYFNQVKFPASVTSGVINILRTAFSLVDPKKVKNTVESLVSFYAFGTYERKSCT